MSSWRPAIRRRIHFGLAIHSDSVTAVTLRRRLPDPEVPSVTLQVDPFAVGRPWDSLASALRQIRAAVNGRRVTLSISLVPPLVECRVLRLPPLPPRTLCRVLQSDADNYFLTPARPLVVGVAIPPRTASGRFQDALVTAVPSTLLEAIEKAASDTGVAIRRMVPAHAAWLAGAERTCDGWSRSPQRALIVECGNVYEGTVMRDDAPTYRRRFNRSKSLTDCTTILQTSAPRSVVDGGVCGDGSIVADAEPELDSERIVCLAIARPAPGCPPMGSLHVDDSIAPVDIPYTAHVGEFSAAYCALVVKPDLISHARREAVMHHTRLWSRRLARAAAGVVVVAFLLARAAMFDESRRIRNEMQDIDALAVDARRAEAAYAALAEERARVVRLRADQLRATELVVLTTELLPPGTTLTSWGVQDSIVRLTGFTPDVRSLVRDLTDKAIVENVRLLQDHSTSTEPYGDLPFGLELRFATEAHLQR